MNGLGRMSRILPAIDAGIRAISIAQDDGVPRAKNLREAYNNFYVEPVKSDLEVR